MLLIVFNHGYIAPLAKVMEDNIILLCAVRSVKVKPKKILILRNRPGKGHPDVHSGVWPIYNGQDKASIPESLCERMCLTHLWSGGQPFYCTGVV